MLPSNLSRLLAGLDYVRTYGEDLVIQHLHIFLLVADKPGIVMSEIQQRLNMPQGTVSRNIKKLTKYVEKGTLKGYDLLTVAPDLYDRRNFAVFLTQKGEEFLKELDRFVTKRG